MTKKKAGVTVGSDGAMPPGRGSDPEGEPAAPAARLLAMSSRHSIGPRWQIWAAAVVFLGSVATAGYAFVETFWG